MKIKTQFTLMMLLVAATLIAVVTSTVLTTQQLSRAHEQENVVNQITQDAYDLNYLANDFIIYGESGQFERWQSKFNSFAGSVYSLQLDDPEQQDILNNIRNSTLRMKEVFDSLQVSIENSPNAAGQSEFSQYFQVPWSRMAVQSRGLISDSLHLSQLLRDSMDGIIQTQTLLLYILLAVLTFGLVGGFFLTYRRTLKSILALEAGTAIIGSGNLNFRVDEKSKDEIGNLSRAFNYMTSHLKEVMASKADLEKEIAERQKAQEELARARDELEKKVQERTQALAEANEQLKVYGRRITQVQEEERKRIAYELHDDTAQYLAILKLQLDSLIHSGKIREPEIIQKLEFLERDAGRAVNDVRRYSHELRPGVLEHLGLQAALEQIAGDINKLGQLTVGINIEGEEPELSEEIKLGFFRIAQEALNNCRKHSKASGAEIKLFFLDRRIKMTIRDDGVGFDVQGTAYRSGLKGSMGLMSMQERAKIIGADLKIDSQPGHGTTISLEMAL